MPVFAFCRPGSRLEVPEGSTVPGPPGTAAGGLGGLCSLLLQQRCFPTGVGEPGCWHPSRSPCTWWGTRAGCGPLLSIWLTLGDASPSAQHAWSCSSSSGHLPTSRSPSPCLFPGAAVLHGSMQVQREDRSEETGGKQTPLNVMEATASFCQPSPPLHPACLLLFFSLSEYKMSQGLGPNLPWVLRLAPCSSLEVTLEASSVPSKQGVSHKGNLSGNRTLKTLGAGRCGAPLSPFISKPFKMPWPNDQLALLLEEGCTAHRASQAVPGQGEMLRQKPGSKPSEVSCSSRVEAGGVARC